MKSSQVSSSLKSEREVFIAALAYSDADDRQGLLDKECQGEDSLRQSVEALLAEHSDIKGFLEDSAIEKPRLLADSRDLIGCQLGSFTLVRKIGEGGGGSVYLAEQVTPVRRQVALKILKAGLGGAHVISRFEAERQTLARMEHPHIASVIEAGATDRGTPYFVMEYVPGVPVTDYCRDHNLSLEERLDLFIRICRAIEHAHQKGIIHRDLKPSNILVYEQDGQAMPKVIDFGVAKALNPLEGDPHGFTLNETIIGTPAYMSPEQAARDDDIDTRADIYSLGVILYELLTGVTPLAASSPGTTSSTELLKLLGQVNPPRPSSYSGPEKERPGALNKFGRDLDWITLKCLEKDRNRRFASSTELVHDIKRFLDGAPITARPPSLSYQAGKFIVSHRAAITSAAILMLSLVAVTVSSIVFGLRARKAEEREALLRIVAEQEGELAITSAREARLHQYVANINLAHQALRNGNLSKARHLLEPWHTPALGARDPRGFEWWYLTAQCTGDDHELLPHFDSPIQTLAYSPDGTLLAIGAEEHLHLWSVDTRQFIASFPQDTRKVAFFPDGERMITGGSGGINIFNIRTEEIEWRMPGRNTSFDLSPDARELAVGDRQGVTIWNTGDWKRIRFLPKASGPVAFSPGNRTLATGSANGITLWSSESGRPVTILEESPYFTFGDQSIRFSNDGELVFLARNDTPTQLGFYIGVWETRKGKEISTMTPSAERTLHSAVISASSLNRDKNRLATSSWDHSVKLWDFDSGTLIRTFLGHRSEVWSVALSPNGRFIASGSKSGEVRIWPVDQKPANDAIPGPWHPLAFSRDGKTLGALDRDGSFAIIDLDRGSLIERFDSAKNPSPSRRRPAIATAKNLTLLAEARERGEVIIRDLSEDREWIMEVGDQPIEHLTLSPNGRMLTIISRGDRLTSWDLEDTDNPVFSGSASEVLFSDDESTLVSTTDDGLAVVWDTATRSEKSRFQLRVQSRGNRMSLSPDGRVLAATHGYMDAENAITIWDTESGKQIGTLKGHKQGIWCLAFSADGKTLASSGGGGNIRLWNVATLTELLTIESQSRAVSKILFSPNHRSMVTSSPGFINQPELRVFRTSPKEVDEKTYSQNPQ